jgi:hypothetical protein
MQNDILTSLSRLSDAELVVRLKGLVARERETTARRFPVILDMLAEGSVNLTTVKLLASHLTPANHRDVLESARGKKKPEVEEIVARLSPRPDVPASIRRLPTPNPIPPASPAPTQMLTAPTVAASPLRVRPAAVAPLSPDRYKLQLTIAGDTLEKLRLAKDMLGHAIPSSDDAAILDRADRAAGGAGEEEVRRHAEPPPVSRDESRGARSLSSGQARRLAAGSRALRLRRPQRPSLRRASVRGIPPPRPVRPGRRGNRRPDPVAVPSSQRLRRAVVFRQP